MCLTPLFAGRYAGDFMMIGSGVRPLGMGGAFISLAVMVLPDIGIGWLNVLLPIQKFRYALFSL
jgi:hypothetical protein